MFLWTKHSARKNSSLIFKQGKSRKHKKDLEMYSDFVIQVICYTSELEYCFDKISAIMYKKFMEKSSSVPLHIIFLVLLLPIQKRNGSLWTSQGALCPGLPSSQKLSGELKAESSTWCILHQVVSENEFNHHPPLVWEIPACSLSKTEQTPFKTYFFFMNSMTHPSINCILTINI